jgi:hypothetical protein
MSRWLVTEAIGQRVVGMVRVVGAVSPHARGDNSRPANPSCPIIGRFQGSQIISTSSKATAQQFLARLLDEHHRLDRGGRPRRTYTEALERFVHDYLPTLKPMTQVRYRTSFRQLAATFGTLYLDEITRGRLADYASARMKGGTKGATVRRDLATLSCLCSCAVAWDTSTPIR